MEHFNNLTPAEAERLALLSEECGEVIQAIGKILRHGYESHNPNIKHHQGNRLDLQDECGHIQAAIILLQNSQDISPEETKYAQKLKLAAVGKYLHHADSEETE